MLRPVFLFHFLLAVITAQGQGAQFQDIADRIMEEAKSLYLLESASWSSIDMVKSSMSVEHVRDYATYRDADTMVTVFFTEKKKVQYTLRHQIPVLPGNATIKGDVRKPTKKEKLLLKLLKKANKQANKPGFLDEYEGILYNTAMLELGNIYKVFILSGTEKEGILPVGNDYLLTFSKKGKLMNHEKIHRNLIELPMQPEHEEDEEVAATMHTHAKESSLYITSTDICTLLLYSGSLSWTTHLVFSESMVSVLDIPSGTLRIMTKEEYETLTQ